MKVSSIAVLGAGSWGTAVAIHLARRGHHVALWARNEQQAHNMAQSRCNQRYLPDAIFPENLTPTASLTDAINGASYIIIAVPSHAFVSILTKIPKPKQGLAWITKGLDPNTHKLLSELVIELWGPLFPMAIISGPSFAREVARGLPTAMVVASNNTDYQQALRSLFHDQYVRIYTSSDLSGVQLCGAVKNVLAIACGVSDGLQYGANTKAALITRGLAEMTRLGLCLNARPETFMGLAGVGDLVLTCTDDQSRNRRFGLQLGQGVDLQTAEKNIGQVVEGKHNAAQVCSIAKSYNIEMPICEAVNALLNGKCSAKDAVHLLMNRPPSAE